MLSTATNSRQLWSTGEAVLGGGLFATPLGVTKMLNEDRIL